MKNMTNRNPWKKGTFTIEAAVLIPVTIIIFALLIGYCFYVHQINWYTGAAYESAAAGLKEPADAAEKARERIELRSSEQPLGFGTENTDVSSGLKLAVSFEGTVLDEVFGSLFRYRGEGALAKIDPVKAKRLEFFLERTMG